jgi:hypothetical protein
MFMVFSLRDELSSCLETVSKPNQNSDKKEEAKNRILSSPLAQCAGQAAKKALTLSSGKQTLKNMHIEPLIPIHKVHESRGTVIAVFDTVFKKRNDEGRKDEEAHLYESISNLLHDTQVVQSFPYHPKENHSEYLQLAKSTNTLIKASKCTTELQKVILNKTSSKNTYKDLGIFFSLDFPCFFLPDFGKLSKDDRELYETWAQDIWSPPTNSDGTSNLHSFSRFILAVLQGTIKEPTSWLRNGQTLLLAEQEKLISFLALPWNIHSSSMQMQQYISNTCTLHEFALYACRNKIFASLTPESYYSLIIAGLLQAQDFHEENIVFRPLVIEQLSSFLDCQYYFGPRALELSFPRLALAWREGMITDYSRIAITSKSEQPHHLFFQQLKESLALMEALSSQWEAVLWDLDCCLGESNEFCSFTHHEKTHVLLPFFVSFIYQPAANLPLPQGVIEKLKNIKMLLPNLKSWILRHDAPAFLRMGKEKKEAIDNYLSKLLQKPCFSLSYWRCSDPNLNDFSIENLHEKIVEALLADEEFWKLASEVPKEKRKEFALSIMPRLSWQQKHALLERIESLLSFLDAPSLVSSFSHLPMEMKKKAMRSFLKETPLPLSTKEKNRFFSDLSEGDVDLTKIEAKLLEILTPSILSIYKVMYPLLADTLLLETAIQEKNSLKKNSWGCYVGRPLDALLVEYMQSLIRSSTLLKDNVILNDFEKKQFKKLSLKDILDIFHMIPKEELGKEGEALTTLVLFFEGQVEKGTIPLSFFLHLGDADDY